MFHFQIFRILNSTCILLKNVLKIFYFGKFLVFSQTLGKELNRNNLRLKNGLGDKKPAHTSSVNIPLMLRQVWRGVKSKIHQFDSADQAAVAIMHPGW